MQQGAWFQPAAGRFPDAQESNSTVAGVKSLFSNILTVAGEFSRHGLSPMVCGTGVAMGVSAFTILPRPG